MWNRNPPGDVNLVVKMYFFGVVLLLFVPCVLLEKTVKSELLDILKYLPHIQIVSNNFRKSEDLVKFFLDEQQIVSLFIGNQNFSENKVFTSTFDQLEGTLTRYAELQSATYIHIIEDAIDRQNLEDNSRKLWDTKRISKIFFLTKVGLFSYNPFKDSGKLYSLIESDSSKVFHNLHAFPFRVQMFRSVYAVPVCNETGRIEKVLGPDGKVAEALQQKMNFSIMFNEPNKDFFGYVLNYLK